MLLNKKIIFSILFILISLSYYLLLVNGKISFMLYSGLFLLIALFSYNYPVYYFLFFLIMKSSHLYFQTIDAVNQSQFFILLDNLTIILQIGMLAAVVYKLSKFCQSNFFKIKKNRLFLLLLLLSFWFGFEILRNFTVFGMETVKEFLGRYAVLVLPLYTVCFFQNFQNRWKLFKMLIIFFLITPVIIIPVVSYLNNWRFGSKFRLYPATLSLGISYSFVSLSIVKYYKKITVNGLFFGILMFGAFFLILIDSHRSVWVATTILLLVISYFGRLKKKRLIKWAFLFVVVLIGINLIFSGLEMDLSSYLLERGEDIIDPFEEGTTSAWRIMLWIANLNDIEGIEWLIGKGFGGHWDVFLSGRNKTIDAAPHSLYIEILVKTGLVGLFLIAFFFYMIINKQRKWLALSLNKNHPEYFFVLLSYSFSISSVFYFLVYNLDVFTLIFNGISLSTMINFQKCFKTNRDDS